MLLYRGDIIQFMNGGFRADRFDIWICVRGMIVVLLIIPIGIFMEAKSLAALIISATAGTNTRDLEETRGF